MTKPWEPHGQEDAGATPAPPTGPPEWDWSAVIRLIADHTVGQYNTIKRWADVSASRAKQWGR